jgi:MoxR-like ATPase
LKFSLSDPLTGKSVGLHFDKPDADKFLDIKHDDTGEFLGRIEIEPKTRKMVFRPSAAAQSLTIRAMDGSAMDVGQLARMVPGIELDELRNWRVDDQMDDQGNPTGRQSLTVIMPDTAKTVTLPIEPKPGPMTPAVQPYEILGQPGMVAATALAIDKRKHSILIGPTGTGKTTLYRWLAWRLNWNLVIAPIARGTEGAHLVGEYMPTGPALFEWTDGPATQAVRLSQSHPTILVFDELNRIGNIAEFSRVYSVLDDTRLLDLKEKRALGGASEVLDCGQLFIGATSNPSDDDMADYVGVQDLDPALMSRFGFMAPIGYPPEKVETQALVDRVADLTADIATKMVEAATRVRSAKEARFPMSFRELENWALAMPYFGYNEAAEYAVISKAPASERQSIRNLLKLQGV